MPPTVEELPSPSEAPLVKPSTSPDAGERGVALDTTEQEHATASAAFQSALAWADPYDR